MSVYFDYNATTPLDPSVRDVVTHLLEENWGNPSSVHQVGRTARAVLDDFRDQMARMWKCKPSEVVFTSGGTESNNLAIFGSVRLLQDRGRHLITSSIEHHAVLHPFEYLEKKEGFSVTYLPSDSNGIVNPDDLKAAIQPDTILTSIMAANNEVGSIQPYSELGSICREQGVLFHCDAAQAFGKLNFNDIEQFNADLVSCCAHKFHGPKGIGALFIRSPLLPDPILFGGGHENERRAGTENLPLIGGLVSAFRSFVMTPVFDDGHLLPKISTIRQALLSLSSVDLRSPMKNVLNNTISFSVRGADSISVIAALDMEGICASSGSACSAGSVTPSHVLRAMGVPDADSSALVRFSLGRATTDAEVSDVCSLLPEVLSRLVMS